MISNKQKKEFIKRSIFQIINHDKKLHELYKLGVDLINYNDKVPPLMIESLAYIISNNDKNINLIKDDIEWWIYEDVTKIIYINDKPINVKKLDDFIDWLFKHYK